jgi:hypothetical protein
MLDRTAYVVGCYLPDRISDALDALRPGQILGTPGAYAFRLFTLKVAWVQVLMGLAEEQTRSNFKDEAAAQKADTGSEYVDRLHAVTTVRRLSS